MSERIQKMLATAGVASRREIERLIAEGRVLVNGRPAEVGQRIQADDHVRVDGKPVALQRKADPARVLIYKKRVGELVTRDDPEGRRTVFRKLPRLATGRWIAVGRLDINTSGLLLFTNHGELARRLTHPSFEIPRQYAARVLGTVDEEVIARWKAGVELDDGMARFERVEISESEDGEGANQWFLVTVREGRNRLVRRLIESQNHLQVSRLIRLRYGPIELGRGMKSGTAREASPQELAALLAAVKLSEEEAGLDKPRRGAPPSRGAHGTDPHRAAHHPGRGFSRFDDDDDDDEDDDVRPARHARRGDAPSRGAARAAPRGGRSRQGERAESERAAPERGARPAPARKPQREYEAKARPASDERYVRAAAAGERKPSGGRAAGRGPAARGTAARDSSGRDSGGRGAGERSAGGFDAPRRGPARGEGRGASRSESRGDLRGETRGAARSEARSASRDASSSAPSRQRAGGDGFARGRDERAHKPGPRGAARGDTGGASRGRDAAPRATTPSRRREGATLSTPRPGGGKRPPRTR